MEPNHQMEPRRLEIADPGDWKSRLH